METELQILFKSQLWKFTQNTATRQSKDELLCPEQHQDAEWTGT